MAETRAAIRSTSIRKNDQVTVLAGKDRGKSGRVLMVMLDRGRALVEGVNKIKRATRPNPGKNIKGGIVEREASVHLSNLQVVCPDCGKATRVARKLDGDGGRVRTCRRCGATLDRKTGA